MYLVFMFCRTVEFCCCCAVAFCTREMVSRVTSYAGSRGTRSKDHAKKEKSTRTYFYALGKGFLTVPAHNALE